MSIKCTRRGCVRTLGLCTVTALGGCTFGNRSGPGGGTLVIDNDDDQEHTVTLSLRLESTDSGEIRPGETPNATSTPVAVDSATFTVQSDERLLEESFISEPGAYFIEARTEAGAEARTWAGWSDARNEGVAGGFLSVSINQNGLVTLGNPVS